MPMPTGVHQPFHIGDHVEVWSKSNAAWYRDGKIDHIDQDHNIHVVFNKGQMNKTVTLSDARTVLMKRVASDHYRVGDRVALLVRRPLPNPKKEADRMPHEIWVGHQVLKVMPGDSITLLDDEGEVEKCRLESTHGRKDIVLVCRPEPRTNYRVGDSVSVWSESRRTWFTDGKIADVESGTSIEVTYDKGRTTKGVHALEADVLLRGGDDSWWCRDPIIGRNGKFRWEDELRSKHTGLGDLTSFKAAMWDVLDPETVRRSIVANGGPARQDDSGRLPLHFAVEEGSLTLVRALARALCKPPSDKEKQAMRKLGLGVCAQDNDGNTPMHAAARGLRFKGSSADMANSALRQQAMDILLDYGADPDACNHDGLTPKDYCKTGYAMGHELSVQTRDWQEERPGDAFFGSALLTSRQINFSGDVLQKRGGSCIVSFPGKYAELWQKLVRRETCKRLSTATVFLPNGSKEYGQHTHPCRCQKLYGRKAPWGCVWFQHWMENVKKAAALQQQLVVLFFKGEVGQGVANWGEMPLADSDERLGKGLGLSQRGELAYLLDKGLRVTYQDIAVFEKCLCADH